MMIGRLEMPLGRLKLPSTKYTRAVITFLHIKVVMIAFFLKNIEKILGHMAKRSVPSAMKVDFHAMQAYL